MSSLLRLVLISFFFVLVGSQLPAAVPAASARAKVKPKPALPDSVIAERIRAKFAKSKISTNNFQITVQGGTATITGHTEVIQHKGVATRLAKSGGARNVVNKIHISEAARQKASARLAKSRERATAKRAQVAQVKRSEVKGR